MKRATITTLLTIGAVGLMSLVGCKEEGGLEGAGKKADDAMKDAGKQLEGAGDAMKDTLEGGG